MIDSPQDTSRESLSVFALTNSLLRNRRLLFLLPSFMLLLAIGATLLNGVTYISESKFTPNSSSNNSAGIAALAVQFGLSSGINQNEPPIDFYAELLRSQEFLGEVAQSQFQMTQNTSIIESYSGDLVDFFQLQGRSDQERLQKTVELLRKKISVRKDLRANLVIVQVRARRPDLAEQISRKLLDSVDTFNLEKRQSQASAERTFVEERMKQALDELNTAENTLRDFFENNIYYDNSATLRLEAARFQRRVDQHQQVYLGLVQAYEQARIDEVRDTPVITIVDNPEGWVRRERGLIKNSILAILFGLIVGIGLIFGKELLLKQRSDYPLEYSEFLRLKPTFFRSKRREI